MAEESMREQILDAAERRARETGYHGFSFRDVASDVGIKSASVHYHFPTKGALAEALIDRYQERALEMIGAPRTPMEAFDRAVALFRLSIAVEDRMCLCGVFGAERDGLPPEVAAATARYFQRVIEAIDRPATEHAPYRAETILAVLEGALLIARAQGDVEAFERVVADMRRAF